MKDFFGFGHNDKGGRGTTDFRSSKTRFRSAALLLPGNDNGLYAHGDGTGSVRAELGADGAVWLHINPLWGFLLGWRNFEKPLSLPRPWNGRVLLALCQ